MWHFRSLSVAFHPSLLIAIGIVLASAVSSFATPTNTSSVVKVASWPEFAVQSFNRLSISGNQMYISADGRFRQDSGAFIFDISDLTHPRLIDSYNRDGYLAGSIFDGSIHYATHGTNTVIVDLAQPAGSNVLATSTNLFTGRTEKAGNLFFVAKTGELAIVDAVGGTNLQQVGVFKDSSFLYPNDLAVQGNLVFLSDSEELFIINVSDPAAPKLLAKHDLPTTVINGGIHRSAGIIGVYSDHLYLHAAVVGPRELIVWDVSDPLQPKEVQRLEWLSLTPGPARFVDDRLYLLTDGWSKSDYKSTVMVIDLSVPSQPRIISAFEAEDTYLVDLLIDRGHAFILGLHGNVSIFDVTSTNIPLVGQYQFPGDIWNVVVSGDDAYVSGHYGMHVLDVKNPSKPEPVGFLDFWGEFTVRDDIIYMVGEKSRDSRTRGLYIIDLSNPVQPHIIGSYLDEFLFGHGVAISGNTVFVQGFDKFSVFDIETPASPAKIAVRQGRFEGNSFRVHGNFLYVGNKIFDIVDPANPVEVGELDYRIYSIEVIGEILFALAPELLVTFDISNPAAPFELSRISQRNSWSLTALSDNILVAGDHIYDIRIPTNVSKIGNLSISNSVAISGDHIFTSGQNLALDIYQVKIDNRTPQTIEFETPTELLFSNAPIRLDARASSGLPLSLSLVNGSANLSGNFLSVLHPGTITIRATQSGNDEFLPRTLEHTFNAIPAPIISLTPFVAWPGHDRGPARDIKVVDNIAYVAAGKGGLVTLDISDPAHLIPLGGAAIGGNQQQPWTREVERVDIAGNYAYISALSSLEIVDVRDPANLKWVIRTNAITYIKDLAVWRDTNLVTANDYNGISIFDLQDPERPALIGQLSPPTSGLWAAHKIHTDQDFAYVSRDSDIMIADIRTAPPPQILSSFPDSMVGTVSGSLLFANRQHARFGAPNSSNPGFTIVDATDRTNLQPLGNYNTQHRISEIVVSNSFAYLTTLQTNFIPFGPPPVSRLEIVDVNNPQLPQRTARFEDSSILKQAVGLALSGDHAFIADLDMGVQVFNIANSTNPIHVGGYKTTGFARGVAVRDSFAYVADDIAGLQVIELATGNRVGTYRTKGAAKAIAISGRYAFLLGTDPVEGVHVLDINKPEQPTKVSSYAVTATANSIGASGGLVFVISGEKSLKIIDASDPSNPFLSGTYTNTAVLESVTVSGSLAFVAAGEAGIRVIDFSDPANPIQIGNNNTAGQAHDLVAAQNNLYVADGSAGLLVLEVSNPVQPKRLASYPTKYDARQITVDGDRVYLSDANNYSTIPFTPGYGIVAFDVQNPSAPQFLGSLSLDPNAEDLTFASGYLCVAYGEKGLHLIKVASLIPPTPSLSIRTTGAELELFWPADATDFKLQRATTLLPGEGWSDISATVSTGTNQCSIQIDYPAIPTFFRLIKR